MESRRVPGTQYEFYTQSAFFSFPAYLSKIKVYSTGTSWWVQWSDSEFPLQSVRV